MTFEEINKLMEIQYLLGIILIGIQSIIVQVFLFHLNLEQK